MSEESKTDSDYVMMGASGIPRRSGSSSKGLDLDDPNLTQEEKDHRLAIALQQQENAAAYNEHKTKHELSQKASENRTARSGTYTKLAAVRQKDHGMLSVPNEYNTENAYHKSDGYMQPTGLVPPRPGADPREIADFQLAAELQKVEQVDAGTVRTMTKILKEEEEDEKAQSHRTERSNFHLNQKGFKH